MPSPDPERLASQLARLALRRFDSHILWRNFREYAAALAVVGFGVWRFLAGDDRLQVGAIVFGAAFVAGYLWFQHRRLPRLDPAATAHDYQAALLARIDRQIALLGSVRYWYLLPLYVPVLVQVVTPGRRTSGRRRYRCSWWSRRSTPPSPTSTSDWP